MSQVCDARSHIVAESCKTVPRNRLHIFASYFQQETSKLVLSHTDGMTPVARGILDMRSGGCSLQHLEAPVFKRLS